MAFTIDAIALKSLNSSSMGGQYYRYIRTKYAAEPLSMRGAIQNGGRYNIARKFGALYLAANRETCEAEVSQGIAAGLPFKKGAFAVWKYKVLLVAVIVLDNSEILSSIGTTIEEITIPGDHWTASAIGEPLYDRGDVEGLVVPSAYSADGRCLDVFLDRVKLPRGVQPANETIMETWPN